MKKSYKIAIIPTIKASLNLAFENKKTVFLLGWITLLFLLCFDVLNRYFSIVYTISEFIKLSDTDRYITIIIETLIIVPFIVGLYRFYILNENNLQEFKYQRGITEQRIIFRIFWYFKFHKREIFFFIPYVFIAILFLFLHESVTDILIEMLNFDSGLTKTNSYIYTLAHYFITFIDDLVFASMILVWVYLAVSNKPRIQKTPDLIKMIKGNIFRVYLVGLIIYLPVYSIGILLIIIHWIAPSNQMNALFFEFFYALETTIYFTCVCVEIAFISLIYQGLIERNKP
ncbi:MAG: hypothetical protein ACRBDI_06450 [Alphaproteobacteria bacterium]